MTKPIYMPGRAVRGVKEVHGVSHLYEPEQQAVFDALRSVLNAATSAQRELRLGFPRACAKDIETIRRWAEEAAVRVAVLTNDDSGKDTL